MIAKTFKELTVWQRSMELVNATYDISKQLPKMETYILASQMLRAAISIPSNISEGFKRNHKNEFKQFLGIGNASAGELETQLLINQANYPNIKFDKALELVTEVQKMLHSMINKMSST